MDPLSLKRQQRERENREALQILNALEPGSPTYALRTDGAMGNGGRWVPRREVE